MRPLEFFDEGDIVIDFIKLGGKKEASDCDCIRGVFFEHKHFDVLVRNIAM